jgi:thymidylate kinase
MLSKVLPRNEATYSSPIARVPKLVSFSGVDGAGKSTQIEALCSAMQAAGIRFRVVRFWDDVARLHRFREAAATGLFKSDRGVGRPGAPVNRRDKNVQSWYMSCFRFCLYLLDAVSLRVVITRSLRSDLDVIVFDRFIYDELANLNLSNPLVRLYIRSVMALVPRPDLSCLLDADPVEARTRKPEYPLEFLYLNRKAYLCLSQIIGGMKVIDPMPMDDVRREVVRHAGEFLTRKDRNHVA